MKGIGQPAISLPGIERLSPKSAKGIFKHGPSSERNVKSPRKYLFWKRHDRAHRKSEERNASAANQRFTPRYQSEIPIESP
jgi:hypothetical protein